MPCRVPDHQLEEKAFESMRTIPQGMISSYGSHYFTGIKRKKIKRRGGGKTAVLSTRKSDRVRVEGGTAEKSSRKEVTSRRCLTKGGRDSWSKNGA